MFKLAAICRGVDLAKGTSRRQQIIQEIATWEAITTFKPEGTKRRIGVICQWEGAVAMGEDPP